MGSKNNRQSWTPRRFPAVLCLLLLPAALNAESDTRSDASGMETLRVLTVGNSFARDACRYLKPIADSRDIRIEIGTANIGGCTLEKHAMLAAQSMTDRSVKPYMHDSIDGRKQLSLQDYLRAEPWDVVTLQQMSELSYKPESFHPHLEQLSETISQLAPNAEILIHQTWAYRPDSPLLDRDKLTQQKMFQRLEQAYAAAADQLQSRLIPVGTAFQLARSATDRDVLVRDPDFDFDDPVYPNLPRQTHSLVVGWQWKGVDGKRELRLDYKHGNTAGCFLAGLVWFESLTADDARKTTYTPDGMSENDATFFKQIAHHAVTWIQRQSGAVYNLAP